MRLLFGLLFLCLVFLPLSACGGGGGGGSAGGGGDGGTAVDGILNGPNKAGADSSWEDPLSFGETRWAFYADGTGAYQGPGPNSLSTVDLDIMWVRNGADSLTVRPNFARPSGLSISAIIGSKSAGEFLSFMNANPSLRTWNLSAQVLPGGGGGGGSGSVYVTDTSDSSVRVFSRSSLTPLRTFSGGNTELNVPVGIAVDGGAGEIYVANAGSNAITVHAIGSTGNVPVLRRIAGSSTGIDIDSDGTRPSAIALDAVNGEIFVACGNSIRVFAQGASGNVAPLRVIAGNSTGLAASYAITVDPLNNEVIVGNRFGTARVYPRAATGDALPTRVLDPSIAEGGFRVVAVDQPQGELWTARETANNGLQIYARTAMGDATPLRLANWLRNGIAIDSAAGDYAITYGAPPGRIEILDTTLGVKVVNDVGGVVVGVALGP